MLCFYFIASVCLMVVSLFNVDGNDHIETLHTVILIGHNVTYFVFLAGLWYGSNSSTFLLYYGMVGDIDILNLPSLSRKVDVFLR